MPNVLAEKNKIIFLIRKPNWNFRFLFKLSITFFILLLNNINHAMPMFLDNSSDDDDIEYMGLRATSPDRNHLLKNPKTMKSPLQRYIKAKKEINDIFEEMEDHIINTSQFIQALQTEDEIVNKAEKDLFESYIPKVVAIRKVLNRDHMKVAFFGRTSNGKSSVINALLHENILPSGIGHTTNCFCQIQGTNEHDAYIIKGDTNEKLKIVNKNQIAKALCQQEVNERSLVQIFWPRERCSLLRSNVVYIDSPGVDVSENLDDWIDTHCLNADVYVLVLNAETTMSRTEKQFFHTVSQKLSKPNIFILINRWDMLANEPDFQESVKAQHTKQCVDFLTKELKVNDEKEAAQRVFFVSARETLQARLEEAKGNPPHLGAISEGFIMRYIEFQDFEHTFQECISKRALRTKFAQHNLRGRAIARDVRSKLDNICERITKMTNHKLDQTILLKERLDSIEKQMQQFTHEMKQKINGTVEEVEQKVARAFTEEIWGLGAMIEDFNYTAVFHTEPWVLNIYKKELNSYIETGLTSNLHARLSSAITMDIETVQWEMTDRLYGLVLKENDRSEIIIPPWDEPFNMSLSLNCQILCADFQENFNFKYSWGITTMIHRFTGKVKERCKETQASLNDPRSIQETLLPANTPLYLIYKLIGGISREQFSVMSRFTLTSTRSSETVGGLLVAGIMLRTIGWRVLFGIGAVYGCVYVYERLSWNNSAKERAFKAQYLRHATNKLKMIVDLTAMNCSYQAQQELATTFARLCRNVDKVTSNMCEELKATESQLAILEANQRQLKLLRNISIYIQNELYIFESDYITPQ